MAIELRIPEVGESIKEVQISQWLKSEGDEIKADESVAVIDSEKTTFDLPAPRGGRLVKILRQAGDTVQVGESVAQIEPDGEAAKEKPADQPQPAAAKPAAGKPADKAQPEPSAGKPAQKEKTNPQPVVSRGKSTPKRNGNTELKKDETKKPPEKESPPETEPTEEPKAESDSEHTKSTPEDKSGPSGSSKSGSAKPAAAKSSAPPSGREEEVVPMTMLRRTVAKRLVEAKQQIAMLTTFGEVDMSAAQALRHEHQDAFQKRYQTKLGLMSFFVKAAIDALKQFPQINAEIRANDIVYHNYFDVGVAIATERGLVVPVLRDAERLGFAEVERAIGDFSQRAKDGKLKPDELVGGTFTITNGGVFGSLLSTPIINPPQTAILGLHAIQERPVALQGQVVIRPMMYVALTYDHLIVDGREAVLFLRRIKEAIETPARMLVEI